MASYDVVIIGSGPNGMLAGAYFAPFPMLCLGLLVCFIQAFVFYLLSTMYFTLALEEAH